MIEFDKYTLDNGLRVILHRDESTPLAAVNILYDVGARDEDPGKTGFAHLFEHLMFGGSVNIPSYDTPLQRVGGENNAFTNNDITNYYITLPKDNLETALWLESDRMLSLAFSEKSLEVQRKVVIEEYKQRYLNQPYGDVWLLLRPIVYKKHPYQWATIGKDITHIENARMEDVKDFFDRYYTPNNAILSIAGNIDMGKTKKLIDKWFANIPSRDIAKRQMPEEDAPGQSRHLTVERDVPVDALYKVWLMDRRADKDYQTCDLISDLLATGKSSRLYNKLVKQDKLMSEVDAYITGNIDNGLIVVAGKPTDGNSIEECDRALCAEIEAFRHSMPEERELQKVKNKVEANLVFSEMNVLNKAMSLAYHELVNTAGDINREIEKYQAVSAEDIHRTAQRILAPEKSSTLYYKAKRKS